MRTSEKRRLSQFAWMLVLAVLAGQAGAGPLTWGLQPVPVPPGVPGDNISGEWDPLDLYRPPCPRCVLPAPGIGIVWLNPLKPVYTRVPTAGSQALVAEAYPVANGWSYALGGAELSDNSLIIRTYDAQGSTWSVGADFYLEYKPHGDPEENIHWIQVVTTNHRTKGRHGVVQTFIDNGSSPHGRLPYCDDGSPGANGWVFYDTPRRIDTLLSHFWTAELMLVTGPAVPKAEGDYPVPGQITYLASVTWGWRNVAYCPNPWATLFPRWGRTRRSEGVTATFDADTGMLTFEPYQINDLLGGEYENDLWMGATVTVSPMTLDAIWSEPGYLFTNEEGQLLVEKEGQTLLSADVRYAVVYDEALPLFGFNFWAFMENVEVNTELGSAFAADYAAALRDNPDFPPELFGLCPTGIAAATNGFQQSGQISFDGAYGGQCDIPEPVTLGLVVIGLLTLTRRRCASG